MKTFSPAKNITVYDDVYGWNDRNLIFDICRTAPYRIGWKDNEFDECGESFLYSKIEGELWYDQNLNGPAKKMMGILSKTKAYQKLNQKRILKTIINCDTISDSHELHVHQNEQVILYYVNTEWKSAWGGETFFYDNTGKKIMYTSPYSPNRMIHFDGEIIHRFSGPNRIGPKFRFSVATFFEK